jgi:CRISPR system Cascade subunit CasE
MYLSKLTLNRSRAALSWVARPYRVHQRLCLAFGAGEEQRLLYRIEAERELTTLLVQSHSQPDWAAAFGEFPVLAAAPVCKAVEWGLSEGQLLAFRLRANPTARKRLKDGSKKRIGLDDELEQLAWLARKGEQAGFRVLRAQARQDGLLKDTQTSGEARHALALLSVQFDGALQVANPERLRTALAAGIGSGKGLGFGLLSLAPLRG